MEEDGEQDGNKLALAIVPSIAKTKDLIYCSEKNIWWPIIRDANNSEVEDINMKGQDLKRLRKEDGESDVHNIEMRLWAPMRSTARGNENFKLELSWDYAPSVIFIMETQIDNYQVENL